MIKLEVEEYCHKCNHFKSDVENPIELFSCTSKEYYGDFIIRCEHAAICRDLLNITNRKGSGSVSDVC